ncbi:hypothetical protein KAU59_03280, partial [candidate division WOR-3 bacterium]|nr:hypothetical protein [candidate division WOR-3 bacterium]
ANLALGFPADLRDYGIGAQILVDLGLSSVRLLTNNPKKIIGLEGYGLKVTKQIPIFMVHKHNVYYLKTKREKLGHLIPESVLGNIERCDQKKKVLKTRSKKGRKR